DVLAQVRAKANAPAWADDLDEFALGDAPGLGVGDVQVDERLGLQANEPGDVVVLRPEVGLDARARVEDERKLLGNLRRRERPLARLGVDGQRLVAVLAEPFRRDLELPRRRLEAGLAVRAQPAARVLAEAPRRLRERHDAV